jgi:carbonic anhydrase/acetyltransferase-like protein (isoleucine patch superfamily)
MAQQRTGICIDPTAEVHPSVLIEGNVTIGPFTKVDSGTILTGNITIGHHTLIRCNVAIRGTVTVGNYIHIYDLVNIEGGRPGGNIGSVTSVVADKAIIGDGCWINHGATMHGTQIGDASSIGLNACCDYNTRIGNGVILTNGSATHYDQILADNTMYEGVPAKLVKENITDEDRTAYFGLIPEVWCHFQGDGIERSIRERLKI